MKAAKFVQKIGDFSVFEVSNPGGTTAFRVSGSCGGKQLRKQFKTLEPAIDWAGAQAKAKTLSAVAPEFVSTILPPREQFEAKEALELLHARFPQVELREVVEFYFRHHKSGPPISLGTALLSYVNERKRELEDQTLSTAQAVRIEQELLRFRKAFGDTVPINTISTAQLQAFIRGQPSDAPEDSPAKFSNKTYNNRRGYLCHFFNWCFREELISVNPMDRTTAFRKTRKRSTEKEGLIRTMTVEEVANLMSYVETNHNARLVPYIVMCLFAGIRPDMKNGEIKRFQEKFIDFTNKTIGLPGHVTKTGKPRDITIHPNLRAWLHAYPLSKYPIRCTNFRKRMADLRSRFNLGHDELRHTFISMTVAENPSVANAAMQAGNTEGIVWAHYLRLGISQREAQRFWTIGPKGWVSP